MQVKGVIVGYISSFWSRLTPYVPENLLIWDKKQYLGAVRRIWMWRLEGLPQQHLGVLNGVELWHEGSPL